ncbi:hypothetical protein K1719_039248 [Acacia pycnantha]|nr:hypothetical protein K1719_039248 [Acacia pycnantha]
MLKLNFWHDTLRNPGGFSFVILSGELSLIGETRNQVVISAELPGNRSSITDDVNCVSDAAWRMAKHLQVLVTAKCENVTQLYRLSCVYNALLVQ